MKINKNVDKRQPHFPTSSHYLHIDVALHQYALRVLIMSITTQQQNLSTFIHTMH